VLTGAEASGDWTQDAPGVARHITVDALPAPFQTRSAGNRPSLGQRPEDARPLVGDAYRVKLFKGGLDGPRALAVAPNGDVFVALSQRGQVRVLRPGKGGERAGSDSLFADDLDLPYGIAFYPPGPEPKWVYVGETDKVVRFPYAPGSMKPGGKAQTIVAELPDGGHWTRDVAFSADGTRLFVAVGSASNVAQDMAAEPEGGLDAFKASHAMGAAWGDEAGRAEVRVFDPQGKGGRAYATGIRNCAGLALQPATGELWCATNERDGLGDNLPPDYATPLRPGAFYGWPWYYIGDHQDPRHQGARPDLAGQVTVPGVLIQPHSAPLGIAFASGDDLGG
jgi:glucose/arabinose dehydrogenase